MKPKATDEMGEKRITNSSNKMLIPKIYKELIQLNTKNPQSDLKIGKGPEQTILPRRHSYVKRDAS